MAQRPVEIRYSTSTIHRGGKTYECTKRYETHPIVAPAVIQQKSDLISVLLGLGVSARSLSQVFGVSAYHIKKYCSTLDLDITSTEVEEVLSMLI